MFNKVILVGNLTRDVEVRYLQNGNTVATLGMATNRRYKDANGENRDETCFIDVTLFGRSAEVANQYLKKGSRVLIEGRLKLDTWTDQSGQKRSKHTVVAESMQMMDTRGSSSNDGESYSQITNNSSYSDGYDNGTRDSRVESQSSKNVQNRQKIKEIDINEDDIPF